MTNLNEELLIQAISICYSIISKSEYTSKSKDKIYYNVFLNDSIFLEDELLMIILIIKEDIYLQCKYKTEIEKLINRVKVFNQVIKNKEII